MPDEQTHHFDVDVFGLGGGRTRRIQVERNHQLGSPRWRIFVSDDAPDKVTHADLVELVRQQTIELRRVADRLEDLAALMLTGRGEVLERKPIVIGPVDVSRIADVRP